MEKEGWLSPVKQHQQNMSFWSTLTSAIDSLLAPASASDSHSVGHDEQLSSPADWSNNYGTAANHQVPAEEYSAVQSWDWADNSFDTGDSFSSSGEL